MTQYDRMIESRYWTKELDLRTSGLERLQGCGVEVDPVYIAVAQDEIDFIWPMSFEEDRIKLASLRARLKVIRRIEQNRPEVELPTTIPFYGYLPT